ncbi:SRPBCC family protein [Tenacibaculum maritimum]|uniref:SRPBCC family protein n=1 Tax=Tenacibaculum maritimum TaxID=107401 RepID=UPI003876C294
MPIIKLQTKIKAEKSIVFDLSRSIDLHKISTKETKEEAVAGRTKGLIAMGEFVTWRAKHMEVYQKLTSRITAFDRPNYFMDEMEQGAFKEFKHKHYFRYTKKRETLMIDCFEYKAPLGILGKLADILFLKKYMTNLLKKRNNIIKSVAESNEWKELLVL